MSGVRLTEAERDQIADAIRKQWSGGRDRDDDWATLAPNWADRWREEVDILPIADILAARMAPIEALADEWAVLADWVDDPDSTPDQRARSKAGVIAATQLREALGLPQHTLLADATCSCGAQHDRRGTGESGSAWFDRHIAALTADRGTRQADRGEV